MWAPPRAGAMARRRPDLWTYLRRRWRIAGGLVVLLLSGLLVLAIADRGHDPVWDVRAPGLDRLALSPDGEMAYLLVRGDDAGPIVRLEARRADDGEVVWRSDLRESEALIAAGDDGVALATGLPSPSLSFLGKDDGRLRWEPIPTQGTPRALRVDGDRVALALTATGNPVLLVEGGDLARVETFDDLVRTIDLKGGRLAVGTSAGDAIVLGMDGEVALRLGFPISVDAVSLASDGERLAIGGIRRGAGDLRGAVAVLDVDADRPLRWMHNTSAGVGLVDIARDGARALVVEQSASPGYALRVYDAETGVQEWAVTADGPVGRDDAGAFGGAALAPDGGSVVYATPLGDLRAYSLPDGALAWSYRAEGSTVVLFAQHDPSRVLATARLVASGPIDAILMFTPEREPLGASLPVLALAVTLATLALGTAILGVGFWRVRRP